MKELIREVADIVSPLPGVDRNRMLGILGCLDTEEQAYELLDYLKEKKANNTLNSSYEVLCKAMKINGMIPRNEPIYMGETEHWQ